MVRIETDRNPILQLLMLRMARVSQHSQEPGIAIRTTTVLGRAGPSPGETDRILDVGFGLETFSTTTLCAHPSPKS
jgi:hypothetical protein